MLSRSDLLISKCLGSWSALARSISNRISTRLFDEMAVFYQYSTASHMDKLLFNFAIFLANIGRFFVNFECVFDDVHAFFYENGAVFELVLACFFDVLDK